MLIEKKLGFFGAGEMTKAILSGLFEQKKVSRRKNIFLIIDKLRACAVGGSISAKRGSDTKREGSSSGYCAVSSEASRFI